MEVALGGFTIFTMFGAYKVQTIGLPELERRLARWLLADARSWDAKAEAKKAATKEFAELK